MTKLKATLILLLLPVALAAGGFLKSPAFQRLSPEARKAIVLAAKSPQARPRLARYPGWTADAEAEDGDVWHVSFERGDEWLGEAYVNLATRELLELSLPVEPTPAERARVVPVLRRLAAADEGLKKRLAQLEGWEEEIRYDKWEEAWFLSYWKGAEAVEVRFAFYDGRWHIDEVFDPLELNAEEARRHAQDRAIQLAYEVPEVGRALEPYDAWKAYAAPETPDLARWTVSFAVPDRTIVSVRIDVTRGEALEVEAP